MMAQDKFMKLRLRFPPTPENASKLADLAVQAARDVDGFELDYSPESLTIVDTILGKFHSEGMSEKVIGETVFSFGCYVGEVLVRHNKGHWSMSDPSDPLWGDSNMMFVELPDGSQWNAIGKAFKLLQGGNAASFITRLTMPEPIPQDN
jgi:hypothetical protein